MDTLKQISATQDIEEEQIVTFHEDGDVAVEQTKESHPSFSFLDTAVDSLEHSVKDFLNRPVEIRNFDWPLAASAGTELTPAISLPQHHLEIPMIREKLQGFTYMRCDYEIKFQVNAQPFHAGRLLILLEPLGVQQVYTPTNMLHFGGATGYSHVDLDLSESTSATIKVPFLSNITSFDLLKAIGNLGNVRVFVYSPLTGTTDVEATVWLQATNISVQVPTGLAPWPRETGRIQANLGPGGNPVAPAWPDIAAMDPAVQIKKEKPKKGLLEIGSRVVSGIAAALTMIPGLTPVAATVGFIASAVAGVSSIFGFSKPHDNSNVQKIVPVFAQDMTNFNGDAKVKVMALDKNNETIFPIEVYGTKEDELSLRSILSKPVFLDRFTFTRANLPNQVIWQMPVSPLACAKVALPGFPHTKLNTRLSYLSEMFGNWRGSIVYNFKFIKTIYHSARLRISFVPGAFEDTPIGGVDINKVYSHIVDLRTTNVFDFEVPFVYNQPWMSLSRLESLGGFISESIPTGMIYVEVLNALRNPAAAADTIEVIVEVAAGDDFQFSYPMIDVFYAPIPSNFPLAMQTRTASKEFTVVRKLGEQKGAPVAQNKSETATGVGKGDLSGLKPVVAQKAPSLPVKEATKQKDFTTTIMNDLLKPEFIEMSNEQMLSLPMGKDNEIAVILAEAHPVAQYTLYQQQQMWRDFVANNPQTDRERAWPLFIYQYPVPSMRSRREVGEIQAQLMKREGNLSLLGNVYGMGEIVLSLRQLLKRYQFLGTRTVTGAQALCYTPGAFSGSRANDLVFNTFNHMSYLDRIAQMYRWYSGSFRVALTLPPNALEVDAPLVVQSRSGFISDVLPFGNQNLYTTPSFPNNTGVASTVIFPTVEKFMEIQLPMYQRSLALPTQVGGILPADLDRGTFGLDYVPANYGTMLSINGPTTLNAWTAVGEDFSFGYLIGPPLTGRLT